MRNVGGVFDADAVVPESIVRTVGRPLHAPHPEDWCEDCGRRNISWFVDSQMWNAVAREPHGENYRDPMLCPACFVLRAEDAGIVATWEIKPEPATLKGWPRG